MSNIFDTILLLSLPAAGKSEIRRFLKTLDRNTLRSVFHLGNTIGLDDYHYVSLMRQIDLVVYSKIPELLFFRDHDDSFKDSRDWGTLIGLLNEDYEDLKTLTHRTPDDPAEWFLTQIDRARAFSGAGAIFESLSESTIKLIKNGIRKQAEDLIVRWNKNLPSDLCDVSIVIEFARGGSVKSRCFEFGCNGYGYSLPLLGKNILRNASIFYVRVTPEISRRRNHERTDTKDPDSSLFHSVPPKVMKNDYGCDDIEKLINSSINSKDILTIGHNESFLIPIAILDNTDDLTTFARNDRSLWRSDEQKRLAGAVSFCLDGLWNIRKKYEI